MATTSPTRATGLRLGRCWARPRPRPSAPSLSTGGHLRWSDASQGSMIEHVFDNPSPASVLDDDWLRGALDELTERWRADAGLDASTRRTTDAASRLSASFEAGSLHIAEVRAAQAMIGAHEARRGRGRAALCPSPPPPPDPAHSPG